MILNDINRLRIIQGVRILLWTMLIFNSIHLMGYSIFDTIPQLRQADLNLDFKKTSIFIYYLFCILGLSLQHKAYPSQGKRAIRLIQLGYLILILALLNLFKVSIVMHCLSSLFIIIGLSQLFSFFKSKSAKLVFLFLIVTTLLSLGLTVLYLLYPSLSIKTDSFWLIHKKAIFRLSGLIVLVITLLCLMVLKNIFKRFKATAL